MSDLRTIPREFLSHVIEIYKQHECLWKIKSKEYSDRNKKYAAYELLINKLKVIDSDANKDNVKKLILSVPAFERNLKK
jgi:hypothetical protein